MVSKLRDKRESVCVYIHGAREAINKQRRGRRQKENKRAPVDGPGPHARTARGNPKPAPKLMPHKTSRVQV